MATINLGSIKFNWKGAFNNSTAYAVDDVVSASGNSYVCIQASQGNAVGNATAYWNIMSSVGAAGAEGGTSTLTTQGDLLYRDGSGLQRLAKGTASKVLAMNSAANAPEWVTGGGGKILQVKSVTFKDALSSTAGNGSFVNITGATLAITPSATSSKILFQAMISTGGQTYGVVMKIQRGGSDISGALATVSGNRVASTAYSSGHSSDNAELQSTYISYLDSPSSTNAQTYTVQGSARYQPAAVAWTVNYPYDDSNNNYTAHSVSTITLMEVGV